MNILLISPDSDNEGLWVTGEETTEVMNNMVPLGLATIAALTPGDIRVDIHDEVVHGPIDASTTFDVDYDLVGVTGFKAHLKRAREIAREFRRREILVAVGGPGVSSTPDAYEKDFDILFVGETEFTWPKFIEDFRRGAQQREYRQIAKPDLADSPMPKWDSIAADMNKYAMGCVQTTRGCPFDCEFCDVVYLFGRRSRHKPIETVLGEVKALEAYGMKSIFFCDDEFIGDPKYAKQLLLELIPLNNSFDAPLTFSTQLTMNLSKDDELLELLADANFNLVFIGVETPNIASLKETRKLQNVRTDLAGDIRKVLSYGIAIRAGTIVGFDNDGLDIFDVQAKFIQEACLPSVATNMLKAPYGTRLWGRLRKEGRVVDLAPVRDLLGHPRSFTNVLPKKMTRVELLKGYKRLLQDVNNWDSFTERIKGLIDQVKRKPNVREPRLQPQEVIEQCMLPSVPRHRRVNIEDIVGHTMERAPFMLKRVRAIIVQFAKYLETLEGLYPQIDNQIHLEEEGLMSFDLENRPIVVPLAFRNAYKAVFPRIYRRVYVNLDDSQRVPEALSEVFVDFLVRWGNEFENFEDHHQAFMDELCDQTCARFNGIEKQVFGDPDNVEVDLAFLKRSRLGDDILHDVEQQLVTYKTAEAAND